MCRRCGRLVCEILCYDAGDPDSSGIAERGGQLLNRKALHLLVPGVLIRVATRDGSEAVFGPLQPLGQQYRFELLGG